MRLFRVEQRHSAAAATVVANGVEFDDGVLCVRWLAPDARTAVFETGTSSFERLLRDDQQLVWVTTLGKPETVVPRITTPAGGATT